MLAKQGLISSEQAASIKHGLELLATKAAVEGRQQVKIHTPLISLTKGEIIRRGIELGERSLGFIDVPLGDTEYVRANVHMVLELS